MLKGCKPLLTQGKCLLPLKPLCVGRFPVAVKACLGRSSLAGTSAASLGFVKNSVQPCIRRSTRSRSRTVDARAMVNVDFASPSLILGAVLIGCGVMLLQMRNLQTKVSRDADIVVAAMISIVGSTLIFQGWRLDPLLLLCQALTTSVAVWYGVETFRLRSKDDDLPDHTAPGMLAPPPGQQDFGIPPLQQPFTTFSQQFGEYPLEPMAAPDTSGYMSGGPQGAVPVTGPYLPPAREQLYPWGPAQQATFVQTEAGPIASEAEGFGRWGTPQQPLNLADPSTLPSSHFNQTAYEQPAYDAAPGVYGQGSAPAASDFYSQQQQQQQETLYGTHPTESWLPSQQPLTAEASDAPQQLLQQQQWFGAADARPGFAQGPPLEGHHQAHAPASHGAFSVGSNPLDSSLVTGTAASPTAAAMKQPAVSSEPIDDWE